MGGEPSIVGQVVKGSALPQHSHSAQGHTHTDAGHTHEDKGHTHSVDASKQSVPALVPGTAWGDGDGSPRFSRDSFYGKSMTGMSKAQILSGEYLCLSLCTISHQL